MTHHILVDEHGAPVPLPFFTETKLYHIPVTIHDLVDEFCVGSINSHSGRFLPNILGLSIMSEEEFMKGQQP